MSRRQAFTSMALDQLVDESIAEADQFKGELDRIDETQLEFPGEGGEAADDYLTEADKPWGETKDIVNRETGGGSISFGYVYRKIANLIDNGNAALEMLQSIDLDVADPSLIGATSSLMNAIRGCISEFTKIHQQWIRFNQTMKLEDKRLENRMKLIKYRNEVQNGSDESAMSKATELYEVKSADLVAFLKWKKEQEALEKQKDEKI